MIYCLKVQGVGPCDDLKPLWSGIFIQRQGNTATVSKPIVSPVVIELVYHKIFAIPA